MRYKNKKEHRIIKEKRTSYYKKKRDGKIAVTISDGPEKSLAQFPFNQKLMEDFRTVGLFCRQKYLLVFAIC